MSSNRTTDPAARAALLGAAAAPSSPLDGPPALRELGKYEILASIGQGGMGEVYVAQPRDTPARAVALKVLSEAASRNQDLVGMFIDEASIMTQIEHPNVLDISDFGDASGRFYIAMEYLQGRSLARVIVDAYKADGAIDHGLVAVIGADAARGLHAAHTAKSKAGKPLDVVHRDVSPENLFVTYAGVTKVIDFGIARASERVTKTAAGMFKGKASYMSPEQVASQPIDGKSDVFSLGVCLWEMITGRRLFLRENQFASLNAVQEAAIPPPSELTGRPDPALDAIVLAALERDRTKRLGADALAAALEEYASRLAERPDHRRVAVLLSRLFGKEAEEERRLLSELLARKTTEEMIGRLRELSGVAPAPGRSMTLTFAGRPGDAEAWDDFGLERWHRKAEARSDQRRDVRQAIDALQAELVSLKSVAPSRAASLSPSLQAELQALAAPGPAPEAAARRTRWLVIGAVAVIVLAAVVTALALGGGGRGDAKPEAMELAPIEIERP